MVNAVTPHISQSRTTAILRNPLNLTVHNQDTAFAHLLTQPLNPQLNANNWTRNSRKWTVRSPSRNCNPIRLNHSQPNPLGFFYCPLPAPQRHLERFGATFPLTTKPRCRKEAYMPAAVPFITQANARELALLSHVARRRKQPKATTEQLAVEVQDARAREYLELLHEQILDTRTELRDKTGYCEHCKRGGCDGKTRAQLLGALDRLLERYRVWSQRAGPPKSAPSARPRTKLPELG